MLPVPTARKGWRESQKLHFACFLFLVFLKSYSKAEMVHGQPQTFPLNIHLILDHKVNWGVVDLFRSVSLAPKLRISFILLPHIELL